MNLNRTPDQHPERLNNLATLLALVMLSFLTVAPVASSDTPTTAELLAQVTDPATATLTATAPATDTQPATASEDGFSTEQLEQLVAPIALYPDALLMQILMASTYPLEIIEAERWIRDQPDLKGDALDEALKGQDWDPSVKSLTTLPSVLKQMSENLDWTQDIGDAFLAQQNDLLDTVQRMRGLAYDAGNLETTEQQTVQQQEDKIIVIESTSPEVIYVPTYSPTVVYGPAWGYPYWYYPYWYRPYPPGTGFVAFGVGVAVGAAIWGGCRWGWGRNNVNININRQNNFNRNTSINGGNRVNAQGGRGGTSAWQHDASHRKGVNYSNSNVAQKFGASSGSNRVTNNQARGHSTATASNRARSTGQAGNRSTGAQAGNRSTGAQAGNRSTGAQAGNRSTGAQAGNRSTGAQAGNRSTGAQAGNRSSSSAFSGSRSPSTDRMSSSRGANSRGTASYGGSRGGMSRGGGRRR